MTRRRTRSVRRPPTSLRASTIPPRCSSRMPRCCWLGGTLSAGTTRVASRITRPRTCSTAMAPPRPSHHHGRARHGGLRRHVPGSDAGRGRDRLGRPGTAGCGDARVRHGPAAGRRVLTTGTGVLNVTAPPNGNIAPPGYYMLFVLNAAGVPSVAHHSPDAGGWGDTAGPGCRLRVQ